MQKHALPRSIWRVTAQLCMGEYTHEEWCRCNVACYFASRRPGPARGWLRWSRHQSSGSGETEWRFRWDYHPRVLAVVGARTATGCPPGPDGPVRAVVQHGREHRRHPRREHDHRPAGHRGRRHGQALPRPRRRAVHAEHRHPGGDPAAVTVHFAHRGRGAVPERDRGRCPPGHVLLGGLPGPRRLPPGRPVPHRRPAGTQAAQRHRVRGCGEEDRSPRRRHQRLDSAAVARNAEWDPERRHVVELGIRWVDAQGRQARRVEH